MGWGWGAALTGDMYAHLAPLHPTAQVEGEQVPAYFELAVLPEGAASSAAPGVGRLEIAHLADHPAAAAALQQALKPGARLGPLLVLQRLEVRRGRGAVLPSGWVTGCSACG